MATEVSAAFFAAAKTALDISWYSQDSNTIAGIITNRGIGCHQFPAVFRHPLNFNIIGLHNLSAENGYFFSGMVMSWVFA